MERPEPDRPIPWRTLSAFYGEGVILGARWAGTDLEVDTEHGTDVWPDGDVEAVHDAMTRIAHDFLRAQQGLPPDDA